MVTAENKAIAEQFIRDWIGESAGLPLTALASMPDRQYSSGAFVWHLLQACLSETDFETEHVVGEDDFVVVLGKLAGVQTGSLFGVPADGRAVTVRVAFAFRVEGPRVTEYRVEFEPWGLLEQLDVNPLGRAPRPFFGSLVQAPESTGTAA